MRFLLAAAITVALAGLEEGKPRLVVVASPRMAIAPPWQPAVITVRAVLYGVESADLYCPKVTFVSPDGQKSVEESDCAPYEHRNECWPPKAKECFPGFRLNRQTGQYEDFPGKECPCNMSGYPRIWSRKYSVGQCPTDNFCEYEITVVLEKGNKKIRESVVFSVR